MPRERELAFRIPFGFLAGIFSGFQPVRGSLIRGNFYKSGDRTPEPHYVSWNFVTADKPDFHRSIDFGELCLGSDRHTCIN
ncbi:carbohydrate-binding family 9-like protein [uncultured Paenibacillus sp.]|uniref:carbohydrate-binding family 9-like protein n=1 Tax=uncultured Paenibacillus sp. TaxID=227322 RepID=UPI0037DD3718